MKVLVPTYGMRTFTDFIKAQNEAWFGLGKYKSQLNNHPDYGAAFAQLLQKHNGDEKAAEEELLQIASTPAGKFQLKRMSMGSPTGTTPEPEKQAFQATNLSGPQMFGGLPGSTPATKPARLSQNARVFKTLPKQS